MLTSRQSRFPAAAAIGVLLGTVSLWMAARSLACSVPVFRYGLEHWTADPYQALVLHRGALTGEPGAAVELLQSAGANLKVQAIDLDVADAKAEWQEVWRQQGSPMEPWLVVKTPASSRVQTVVWSSALTNEMAKTVVDSPARSEIVTRLKQGESAVWVLLECGDVAKDDAAEKALQSRLDYLAGVMELPKLDDQDIKNGLVSLPQDGLRLAFSVLRIKRSDPKEAFTTPMLLAVEEDLKGLARQPMAFPVFGQGRALYALVGPGIRNENIDEANSFLIGSCSCEVKEQNPGADLLFTANWDDVARSEPFAGQDLPRVADILKTPLSRASVADVASAVPESSAQDTVSIQPAPLSAPTAVSSRSGIVAGVGGLILVLAGWLMWRRVGKTPS